MYVYIYIYICVYRPPLPPPSQTQLPECAALSTFGGNHENKLQRKVLT